MRDHVNWNSQIIWKMRSELAFQWDLVEEEIPALFEAVNKSVNEALCKVRDTMICKYQSQMLDNSSQEQLDGGDNFSSTS